MNWMRRLVPRMIKRHWSDMSSRTRRTEARVRELEAALAKLRNTMLVLHESPVYVAAEDLGFNGQRVRKAVFAEMAVRLRFEAVVETGTALGSTTGWLAQAAGVPVWTCECEARHFAIARQRLRECPDVRVERSESRTFLRALAKGGLTAKNTFFYLDAHGSDDVPLREEIEIICDAWERYTLMIDDFRVPGDDGYGFDTYGGRALDVDLVRDLVARYDLQCFFPAAAAAEETGARRGWVVAASRGACGDGLASLKSLRRWVPEDIVAGKADN